MKPHFFIAAFFLILSNADLKAQESFYIKDFDIAIKVNKDASLDVTEKISVHFTEPRHGIFRKIPFKYPLKNLPHGSEMAQMDWVRHGYRYTKLKQIDVKHFESNVQTDGDYKTVRIGSKDKMVDGDQIYEIHYIVLGAINFFDGFSEFYWNLTGNEWNVAIEKAHFTIDFFQPVPDSVHWFVATGPTGSRDDISDTRWVSNHVLEGHLQHALNPYEGISAGVRLPKGFLAKPDYKSMGKGWLILIPCVFLVMFFVWKKWGKDLPVTIQTQFYPPENVSPSVAGYIIDGKLDRRDLTALIPYWGAGGFLRVEESVKKKLFGLLKDSDYEFIKVKDLDPGAEVFEKTMFNGLFSEGDRVKLESLKNSFYTTMNLAKKELEVEIKRSHYYTTYSRGFAIFLPVMGLILFLLSVIQLLINYPLDIWIWLSLAVSAIVIVVFGSLMSKKTKKGTELYEKLAGFKEFIKSVEKDRLQEFLKQDPNYFDKVLPFAVVFDVADTWKDKLKGLDVPPPGWYSGYYPGSQFNTLMFMNSLDHSMNVMSSTFYSAPSSSGSSGGSFGGGGFSGGGFGGGGGGSW